MVVTCAAIWRQGRLLLARRADSGLWELPGGKQRPGEDLAACLAREISEELGVAVQVLERVGLVRERANGRRLDLHCFACRLLEGHPTALEHLELRWVLPSEMAGLDLCPADRQLAGLLAGQAPAA
ncbi:MAG: (deoxy)nucleoside triphosphate pyrophosphohydrolase [Desulfarculus sp.]|nr:(deoxy)nucleoside triphosphate pyrophosphohydrolase [Desulfarculus sp.]